MKSTASHAERYSEETGRDIFKIKDPAILDRKQLKNIRDKRTSLTPTQCIPIRLASKKWSLSFERDPKETYFASR